MQPRNQQGANFSNASFRASNNAQYQPIHSQNNINGADAMARGLSPYLGVDEDKFGQLDKPMQSTIAAEIKVNRTKILSNQGNTYGTSSQAQNTGVS